MPSVALRSQTLGDPSSSLAPVKPDPAHTLALSGLGPHVGRVRLDSLSRLSPHRRRSTQHALVLRRLCFVKVTFAIYFGEVKRIRGPRTFLPLLGALTLSLRRPTMRSTHMRRFPTTSLENSAFIKE